MNIVFLTLVRISDVSQRGIYTDLLRLFLERGHSVYVVSANERRYGGKTEVVDSGRLHILKVKTLNIQKTNYIEKGIGVLLLENQYMSAINKYWNNIHFDLILYSTPPITLNGVILYLKNKNNAKTYLMLKDIFPQNAVDLGLLSKKNLLYKMFRRKEKKLYSISDYIGCTSPANIDFLIEHNKQIDKSKLEICPNSVELHEMEYFSKDNSEFLEKLNIPSDKTLFIYGGNLGEPQGLDFLLRIVEANELRADSYIIIIGGGTGYAKVKRWFDVHLPKNALLIPYLPKAEYDKIVCLCDVGLVLLDHRFTVPNTPSRMLSYLECRLPILLATDIVTDAGRIAESNDFGRWTVSGNLEEFMSLMQYMSEDGNRRVVMGRNGYDFLMNNWTVEHTYNSIMRHFRS